MKASVLFAALMLGSAPAWALMVPPTDEEVAAAIASFQEKTKDLERGDADGRRSIAGQVADEFEIAELTADQIQKLDRAGIISLAGKRDAARERITQLAKQPNAEGARAALMNVSYVPSTAAGKKGDELAAAREVDMKARADAVLAAMKHPGFGEALKAGNTDLFMALSPSMAPAFAGHEADLLAIEQHLTADLPPAFLIRSSSLVDFLNSESLAIDAAAKDRIRAKLASLVEGSLGTLAEDDKIRTNLVRAKTYLNGAFAKGQLLNHTAPDFEVVWTNAKEPIKSLADLRGKVVVVDFWATWCGPCIGSFPQVRELVKHYEGYPVAVIGVTSVQGFHINHKAQDPSARRIDTKGDEAKEFALMSEFVGQMDMTWPVAFTKQEVFNPEYGVRGIPHVAIIDPNGLVRYNGLHPASPLADKTKKIDALLLEAGLPVPAAAEPHGDAGKTAEAH